MAVIARIFTELCDSTALAYTLPGHRGAAAPSLRYAAGGAALSALGFVSDGLRKSLTGGDDGGLGVEIWLGFRRGRRIFVGIHVPR